MAQRDSAATAQRCTTLHNQPRKPTQAPTATCAPACITRPLWLALPMLHLVAPGCTWRIFTAKIMPFKARKSPPATRACPTSKILVGTTPDQMKRKTDTGPRNRNLMGWLPLRRAICSRHAGLDHAMPRFFARLRERAGCPPQRA